MPAIRIMFGAAVAVAALSLIAQGSTGAERPEKKAERAVAKVRALSLGQPFEWNADEHPGPVQLRAGDVDLLVAAVRDAEGLVGPRIRVSAPGRKAVAIDGEKSGLSFPSRFTVGRWDASGAPFVLVESYTGGAHCCTRVQAALPDGDGFRVVDLDAYDGEKLARLPEDVDRDGLVDFIVTDDSFLYAFGSYAGSYAPPKVLNIVGGKVVDVSSRAGFRPLFAEAMELTRDRCAEGETGYCAAYAAAAARTGRLDAVWGEVIRNAGDSSSDFFPTGCRIAQTDGECPEAETIQYASYEEALKAFLAEHGYSGT